MTDSDQIVVLSKREYMREWRKRNKSKKLEANRKWVAENPEKVRQSVQKHKAKYPLKHNQQSRSWYSKNKERVRMQRYERSFGLKEEQVRSMLEQQQNLCVLCDKPLGEKYAVDHDHDSGKVRALLCGPCNSKLGVLEKNPAWVAAAIRYINTYKGL